MLFLRYTQSPCSKETEPNGANAAEPQKAPTFQCRLTQVMVLSSTFSRVFPLSYPLPQICTQAQQSALGEKLPWRNTLQKTVSHVKERLGEEPLKMGDSGKSQAKNHSTRSLLCVCLLCFWSSQKISERKDVTALHFVLLHETNF